MVGLLVPIRESGSLLPQLFVAGFIRLKPRRKWTWVTGACLQALAALALALLALFGQGGVGGALVLLTLAALALARGLSSIATKDVLGKTIAKGRRGNLMGWSGSVAGAVTLAAGGVLMLFGDRPGEIALATEDGEPPRLALTAADGSKLSFNGEPTADTRYGGPGERMFLEVAAQRQPCNHPLIADMQCLQVREVFYNDTGIKSGEPGEWQPLYEDIEGYQHQPGIRNVVRVYRYHRDPAPADASSIVYVHDMTVESATE